jgi:hypothetical protein
MPPPPRKLERVRLYYVFLLFIFILFFLESLTLILLSYHLLPPMVHVRSNPLLSPLRLCLVL